MVRPTISAIIPSYNGKDLLAACLPQLWGELEQYGHQLIIVDDGSRDGTDRWLAQEYPRARLVRGPHRGFATAVNRGIREARGNYTLLLNNDMLLYPGTLGRLVARLQGDRTLFAAGGCYLTPTGQGNKQRCSFCGGVHADNYRHEQATRTGLDAPAGGGLFRTDLLQWLGGFDELYRPFYWEDIDLGWNAWRAGYRIIFDGRARMRHEHGATIHRYHRPIEYQAANWRNLYLFAWKNLGAGMLARHLAGLPVRAVRARYAGYARSWLYGLAAALPALPRALCARARRPAAALDDRGILGSAMVNQEQLLKQVF